MNVSTEILLNPNKGGMSFDDAVTTALTGDQFVSLFDSSIVGIDVARSINIAIAQTPEARPLEFFSAEFNEHSLLKSLRNFEKQNNVTDVEDRYGLSNYRLLCDSLERIETGIIIIHDLEKLTTEAIHILARLTEFSKRVSLRWRFLIFADLAHVDELTLMQLRVDKYYPERLQVLDKPENLRTRNDADKPNAGGSLVNIGIVAALSLLALVGFLMFNWGQSLEYSDIRMPESTGSELEAVSDVPNHSKSEKMKLSQQSKLETAYESRISEFEFNKVLREIDQQVDESKGVGSSGSDVNLVSKSNFEPLGAPSSEWKVSERLEPKQRNSPTFMNMSDRMLAAVSASNAKVVRELFEAGEDKNAVNKTGETALAMAVIANDQNLVEQLFSFGVSVDGIDQNGHSPLFYAAISGNKRISSDLLNAGAKINSLSSLRKTPLMAATHNGYSGLVDLLIERGAKLNLQDHSGWSALHYAAWNNNLALVELLLEKGANPRLRDNDGYDVLAISKLRGHNGMVALINR